METSRRNIFVSMEQKRLILEFIKKNPLLASGKFSNDFTQKDSQHLWKKLTNILNSSPGAKKDWKAWRKTWQDIRSRTKVKQGKYKNETNATGGGKCEIDPLTSYETEVLDLIKSVSFEGHTNIKESSMEFSFDGLCHVGNSTNYNINNENESTSLNMLSSEITSEIVNDPDTVEKVENANPKNNLTEIINKRKFECDNSNLSLAKNKGILKAPRKKLVSAFQASENYRKSLEHKNKIKEEYYKKKIVLLERMTVAKERIAVAEEKMSDNIEKLASLAEELV